MTPIDIILWVNLAVFLIYIPIICYLDIKYREIDPRIWIPMALVCTPIMIYMYSTGFWYPWYSLAFSILMCFIFHFAMRGGYLEGADALFLYMISMFWVISPYPTAHGLMHIVFYIYFAFTSAITAIVILGYNILNGNEWGIVDMMSKYPRGVPYIIPISVAFLMSVVLG